MIPEFNMAGVIPPIQPGAPGHSAERSPYITDIDNLIARFATSPKRIKILKSFLEFRKCFYELGVVNGFQWIDGSFCQDVERIEARDPGDIDVVTFFYVPENIPLTHELITNINNLTDTEYTKPLFNVDAYGMQLGTAFTPATVKLLSYWYSMWSHRKSDKMWKGFVQLPLSPEEDEQAIITLNSIETREEK
ncbi:DUF6932 family protein [Acinetobacter baumannii]|uniref:DUF6932 family protein n=1 Tax=Acinetobacter baumannii TaxID=470 RepID=UPI0004533DB2|nr:hypothetical protein [Acinetobacter baumannii]EXE36325.1 hypothetical protein J573_3174 [Acinetobacter baumannii 1546444]MCT9423167.1 hypothetical protein [Acinetobacter baumannii]